MKSFAIAKTFGETVANLFGTLQLRIRQTPLLNGLQVQARCTSLGRSQGREMNPEQTQNGGIVVENNQAAAHVMNSMAMEACLGITQLLYLLGKFTNSQPARESFTPFLQGFPIKRLAHRELIAMHGLQSIAAATISGWQQAVLYGTQTPFTVLE